MSFINYDLIPKQVRNKYFEEYLGTTSLSMFMGSSPSSIIQVLDMKTGEGMETTLALTGELDYTSPILDFDVLTGNEQNLTATADTIKVRLRRFADILPGVQLQKQASPIDFFNMMREKLVRANKRNLVKSIFDCALAAPSDKDGGLYNRATQTPTIDRGVYAGIDDPNAYPVNINDGIAAMNTGIGHDENGMSVAHIRKLKSMAIQGGISYERENRITPYELRSRKGFAEEIYVLFIDPATYMNSLVKDPEWNQFFANGQVRSENQPNGLMGSRFRGIIEGVLIYECPELSNYRIVSGGFTAAWNLFCGGQAFGLVWGQRPWFTPETKDYGVIASMAVSEIRGQKSWVFPSKQNPALKVERGYINSFTRIA